MKNYKNFFGIPKMCSNYTSKFQNPDTRKKRPHREIISGFPPYLTNAFSQQFHITPANFHSARQPDNVEKILHLIEMCSNYTSCIEIFN